MDWEHLKTHVHHQGHSSWEATNTTDAVNNKEILDNIEVNLHCKKNHVILMFDISPSMFKYDYVTNSLNIQNLETICKSLLNNLLEAVSEKKKEELDEMHHNTEDNRFSHPIRLTVYLFGMTNKEIELVVNYVMLLEENVNEIFR